jgi:phage terminase large subunit
MAITTAVNKIKDALCEPTFYKVIQGGQSAGKTYAIMWLLESYCGSYPNSIVTVLGLTYDHLATGAIRDFKAIMRETGRWVDEWWNKTEKTYHFPNGSILEFKSVDRMTSRGPRRDVLFVNEANGITYEVFKQMSNRTKDFTILDYNPSSKFWAHEELVEKQADRTTFLVLTYLDNEAISAQERDNIESNKPKPGEEPSNWWIVYGLGQIGSLEGNIYSGWEEVSAEEIRKNGKLVRYGLDFGFGHPTAMTGIYEFEDGSLGITEEIYAQGVLSSAYPELLKSHNIDPSVLIVADAARPEIISDIKQAGWRIVPANKDSGSVQRGISRVQERQIKFAGLNLKKEYLSYAWRKKRSTGETIYEPDKCDDDLMDSLRYAIDDLKKQRFNF